jgi:hypothetical protein
MGGSWTWWASGGALHYRARTVKARFGIAGVVATALVLVVPSVASAAALTATPVKSCYRAGTGVTLNGSGFTPNQGVTITSDGNPLGTSVADGFGNFSGTLTVGVASGEKVKTYAGTDQSNPANVGAVQLRVSALSVSLKPKKGPPERRFKIGARGFTTGKRLYAHIVRGKFRRTVKIGRLKGACHKIKARKRLFPKNISTGIYRVQFDSKRKYSKKTKVKVVKGFQVTRTFK